MNFSIFRYIIAKISMIISVILNELEILLLKILKRLLTRPTVIWAKLGSEKIEFYTDEQLIFKVSYTDNILK